MLFKKITNKHENIYLKKKQPFRKSYTNPRYQKFIPNLTCLFDTFILASERNLTYDKDFGGKQKCIYE